VADAPATEPTPADPDKPKGRWGTILTMTPVILTVLATAFAGLSSSEMTQAMYHRSLAAQHQSRAGDQWAFFQAKRIRGSGLESSVELLQGLSHPDPFEPATATFAMTRMVELLEAADAPPKGGADPKAAAAAVKKAGEPIERLLADSITYGRPAPKTAWNPELPKVEFTPLPDPNQRAAYEEVVQAIQKRKTETETAGLVAQLSPATIDEAVRLAEDDADRFDQACEPTSEVIKRLKAAFRDVAAAVRPVRSGGPGGEAVALFDKLDASFRAAVMDYEARRYRQEAAFNRRAAEAYEVRVRRSGVESDRHRERSKRFFYSMLLAQAGVTIASLALAKAQRSGLWLLAAAAGLVSLVFTGYVFLSY
jgi:hypothetical protein